MTGHAGRDYLIKKNGTTIAGITAVNMTVNGAPVSNEDQTDKGFAAYLPCIMVDRSLEFGAEGVLLGDVLHDIALDTADVSPSFLADVTFEAPNGDVISGDFVMSGYTEGAPFKEAMTFTCTFTSDGAWTFTPDTP